MANEMTRAVALHGIRTEKELCAIIVNIVDEVIKEENQLIEELTSHDMQPYNDIEKLAWIAELKIQIKQVKRIKKMMIQILKRSTNKMIVATIEANAN